MCHDMLSRSERIRCLQYRISRQGTLELAAWLSPLQDAIHTGDETLLVSIEELLSYEVPVLMAMQAGTHPIPQELQPWLSLPPSYG